MTPIPNQLYCSLFHLLTAPKDSILKSSQALKDNKYRQFSLILLSLEVFGMEPREGIKKKLGLSNPGILDAICYAVNEVYNRFKSNTRDYNEALFPIAKQIFTQYKTPDSTDQHLFTDLTQCVYRAFPFSQDLRGCGTAQELKLLQETRSEAVRLLMHSLDDSQATSLKTPRKNERQFSSDEKKFLIAQAYWNGGALKNLDGTTIYFSDLIHAWGARSEQNQARVDAFLKNTGLGQCEIRKPKQLPQCSQIDEKLSFPNFLIEFSIQNLEGHLGFPFNESLKARVRSHLLSEEARGEITYLLARPKELMKSSWNLLEAIGKLCSSVQILYFFVRQYGVQKEKRSTFLEILLSRRLEWNTRLLEDFEGKAWVKAPVPSQENIEFTRAWNCLENGLSGACQQKIQLQFNPTTKRHTDYLQKPICWDLFYFLMTYPEIHPYVDAISRLGEEGLLSLNLNMIHDFCEKNRLSFPHILAGRFESACRNVIKVFSQAKGLETLFFDPPITLTEDWVDSASSRAEKFLQWICTDQIQENGQPPPLSSLTPLLRIYLMAPFDRMMKFLKREAVHWKIHWNDVKFLSCFVAEDLPPEEYLLPRREMAVERAANVRSKYRFTDAEFLLVYIRAFSFDLMVIDELIDRMREICPYIPPNVIFFLFQNPPGTSYEWISLFKRREIEWNSTNEGLNQLELPGMKSLETEINDLAIFLSTYCPDLEKRKNTEAYLRIMFLTAFTRPPQPLTDKLKLRELSHERFLLETSQSQIGQFKSVIFNSSLRDYFTWSLIGDEPYFFFTFVDLEKKIARSDFVSLGFLMSELGDAKEKINYFSFLYTLAMEILPEIKEDSSLDVRRHEEPYRTERGKQAQEKGKAYSPEELQQLIQRTHQFLEKLKITYRKRYLAALELTLKKPSLRSEELFPANNSGARKEAGALGNIYPSSAKYGSLLPELNHPGYVADQELDFIHDRTLFLSSKPWQKFAGWNLVLDGLNECPIFYQVQTVDEASYDPRHKAIGMQGPLENSGGVFASPNMAFQLQGPSEIPEVLYITLGIELVPGERIPIVLQYRKQVLEDSEKFKQQMAFHLLVLKAHYYRKLASKPPLPLSDSPKDQSAGSK